MCFLELQKLGTIQCIRKLYMTLIVFGWKKKVTVKLIDEILIKCTGYFRQKTKTMTEIFFSFFYNTVFRRSIYCKAVTHYIIAAPVKYHKPSLCYFFIQFYMILQQMHKYHNCILTCPVPRVYWNFNNDPKSHGHVIHHCDAVEMRIPIRTDWLCAVANFLTHLGGM